MDVEFLKSRGVVRSGMEGGQDGGRENGMDKDNSRRGRGGGGRQKMNIERWIKKGRGSMDGY